MAFSGCLNDETFGPAVHGCRENFDFTIKFERIFLSLISASLFIMLAQIRIRFLTQRPRMVHGNRLWILKVVRSMETLAFLTLANFTSNEGCNSRIRFTPFVAAHSERQTGFLEYIVHIFKCRGVCVKSLHYCSVVPGASTVTTTLYIVKCLFVPHHPVRCHPSADSLYELVRGHLLPNFRHGCCS